MNILASQNIFNKFNTLINFKGKKEQKAVSNPLENNNTSLETISTAETSSGKAQIAIQNKQVEITPEIRKKVKEFAKLFETEEEVFFKIAQKTLEFFNQNLELMDKHTTESAKRFEIKKNEFVKAALRQPQLFCQAPETLDNNITESAKRFEIKKNEFVKAALRQPQLFCQAPETLDNNITESAKRFLIDKTELVKAALKKPVLFCMSPETLERKAKIYAYYKELMNIPVNNLLECLTIAADKHLLAQVLGILVNQQTSNKINVSTCTKYNQIKEFFENNPAKYNLKIHNREIVTENLLEFAKDLEKELMNKVKFNFKIV